MNKLKYIFILIFAFSTASSCSEDEKSDNAPVIFNDVTVSKDISFIDQTITLDIDGAYFTDVIISSSNPDFTIIVVSTTTYKISASQAGTATLSIQLKNSSYTETESIKLSFFEHGIIDYKIVEGISIDVDGMDKITELLGAPEAKSDSTDGDDEFWYYFSKGFSLKIDKETQIVDDSRIYGGNWSRTINNITYTGSIYPYDLGNDWNFSTNQLKMEDVKGAMGTPNKYYESTTSSTLKGFDYGKVIFFFFSDSIDNYEGQSVPYLNVF